MSACWADTEWPATATGAVVTVTVSVAWLTVVNVAGSVSDAGDTLYVHPGTSPSAAGRMSRLRRTDSAGQGVPRRDVPTVKPAP